MDEDHVDFDNDVDGDNDGIFPPRWDFVMWGICRKAMIMMIIMMILTMLMTR